MSTENSMVEREDRPLERSGNETATIMQVIERAASNPEVDVDKMQRLLDMQERILDRNAKQAYTQAFAEMSPKLPVITERGEIKDRNGNVQSTYAKWEDINDAIKPLLAEHGFSLSFRTGRAEDGAQAITGVLSHREGHSEETTIYLPSDQSGSKNQVQAVGSSTSYGKRYAAEALLNITTRGQDDDGGTAGQAAKVTDDQASKLADLLAATETAEGRFLSWVFAGKPPEGATVSDIPATMFDKCEQKLREKLKRGQQ